jgi:ppGpp synthetase/RelA/SpoT-type nucleotidyltranferase
MPKPKDQAEYIMWLKTELNIIVSDRIEAHFNAVSAKAKSDFENSDFWRALLKQLPDLNNQFLIQTGYALLLANYKPEIVTKSFQSVLIKSFRKNILINNSWPNPPDGGWITPDNCFQRLNDIIRTYFVVKYLDGVDFLYQQIHLLGNSYNLTFHPSYEAREEGYYALHVYAKVNFDVPKLTWDSELIPISIEFQITTQLQDVITKLTHKYYEQRRINSKAPDLKWQWDYKSEEFIPNYLGHILHYVEGMIMEIREKQGKDKHEEAIF